MNFHMVDELGVISGPLEFPEVPGIGVQLPSNGLQLDGVLPNPEPGHVWVLIGDDVHEVEDHRGTVYRVDTGAEEGFSELGPLPPELTSDPKPSQFHNWDGGQWVENPTLLYDAKFLEINRLCELAITAGFSCAALGSPHTYSTQLDDQLNLTGMILRGIDNMFACRDADGVRDFRLHTIEQLRQVGDDFTEFKLELLQKANALKQDLDAGLAANDLQAMKAVNWEVLPA